jgi:alpha-mannosidase
MRRWTTHIALLLALAAGAALAAGPAAAQPVRAPLAADGTIPVWLAAGPFDQPMTGFGIPADADLIGEAEAHPAEGTTTPSTWAAGGAVRWRAIAPDPTGFADFHTAFADVAPGDGPERIWWAKAGYAFTTLHSDGAQEALLLMGSNSHLKVLLNGEVVHMVERDRNAVAGEDTVRVRLAPGANHLLVRVGQTHRNEAIQFFEPLAWRWGFYARVLSTGRTPADLQAEVMLEGTTPDAGLASSFFFRDTPDGLRQRFDLTVTRRTLGTAEGEARLAVNGETTTVRLAEVPIGLSRHAVWLPAVYAPTPAVLEVRLDGALPAAAAVTLEPQPRYELHLMLNSHTDVGYTHPQPTVAETHALLLDAVVARAEAEPDFRWTAETVWQLEQFIEHRAPADVERLMALIREGRVAVSPLYANPFTGWVSEEELLRSLSLSHAYAERYGLSYRGALFNDEPGFAWMLPAALQGAGVSFFVAGLNEVFNDYGFQRTLPKVFRWEGAGSASVVTYLTEAYNEGQTYGMVKGVSAMEDRMRERLQRLQRRGYDYDLVLVNTTLGDNGGIPVAELKGARAWSEQYAYPRITVSNLDAFAEAFLARYEERLPTVGGDWTSSWSTLYQGELARTVRQRWAQHQLLTAEVMSTAAWLGDGRAPLQPLVREAYHHLQQYSAHGSGLEYGYGSPSENAITMAYREQYVQNAVLTTEAALLRATRRLVQPMESFETEALFVFNAGASERDAPIEVEFPRESPARYRVVDPVTERELPSHHEGYTLRFVARDLPAVGYKRLRLEPRTGPVASSDLRASAHAIENAYFRLAVDPATGRLASLTDKRTGRELVRADASLPFGAPVRAVFGDEAGFRPLPTAGATVTVYDGRPARLRLAVTYPGAVVSGLTYTLWEGLERVEVEAAVDLEVLVPVAATEEYGLAFPFALDRPEARMGILGGFAVPERDRFEGIDHDAFSLRQSLALADGVGTVTWAAVDSRVVRLRQPEGEDAPTVVAILANHFPEAWNRNEENVGVWPLRFALTYRAGGFDAAFADGFGRDVAQPPVVYHTWLTADEPVRTFLDLEGDSVHLLAFQPDDDGVLVRLQNPRTDTPAHVRLAVPGRALAGAERTTFLGASPEPLPLEGEAVPLSLGPSEMITVRLRLDGESAGTYPSVLPPTTQEVHP